MDENTADLVEELHRAAVHRQRAEERCAGTLVEQIHSEAAEHHRQHQKRVDELVDCGHRDAATLASQASAGPTGAPTVHFTELREAAPDNPLGREWNTYRREVRRFLAEGHEGRHVLLKGDEIVGFWDTHDAAITVGYHRFPGQPFLVHKIQEREPVLRCVTTHQCPSLHFPLRQAS